MCTAQQVFDAAFAQVRNPRSDAYKQGVLDCLRARLDGAGRIRCPYADGTAESDAYYAGVDEGRALAPLSTRRRSASTAPTS